MTRAQDRVFSLARPGNSRRSSTTAEFPAFGIGNADRGGIGVGDTEHPLSMIPRGLGRQAECRRNRAFCVTTNRSPCHD